MSKDDNLPDNSLRAYPTVARASEPDPHATGPRVCKHCGGTESEHMQGDDGLLCDYDRMLPPLHATPDRVADARRPTETPGSES